VATGSMRFNHNPQPAQKKFVSCFQLVQVPTFIIMLDTRTPLPLPSKYSNDTPEQYLERLMSFYKEYHWLIHVLAFNFVTQKEWEKFPLEWREALMERIEDAGDDWTIAILDLTSVKSDYVSCMFVDQPI